MEQIIQQLITKFEIVKELIQKTNTAFNSGIELLDEFDKIETKFVLNVGPVYMLLYSGESNKIRIQKDFSQILIAEEFSNDLNNLINKIITILKQNKIDLIDNNILIKKYKNKKIN